MKKRFFKTLFVICSIYTLFAGAHNLFAPLSSVRSLHARPVSVCYLYDDWERL